MRVQSYIGDDQAYGVGMPIIITFSTGRAREARADVQKRLFVTSDPPQEGVWHWISSLPRPGGALPAEGLLAGQTKINVRIATGGLPWGFDGIYGGTT